MDCSRSSSVAAAVDRTADVALSQLVEHLLHVVATHLRLVMHVLRLLVADVRQLQLVAHLLLADVALSQVVAHLQRRAVADQLVVLLPLLQCKSTRYLLRQLQ